jgi:hypothetical protein
MLFDAKQERPWGNEQRRISLIFIGRNLNRGHLNEGFRACFAEKWCGNLASCRLESGL